VEGTGQKDSPVVVIDDSLGSGSSLFQAVKRLEASGYFVEGVVALVGFPWRGGAEWARALGYKVEVLFDIWRDIGMPMPQHLPLNVTMNPKWDVNRLPDGLTPAQIARITVEQAVRSGTAPLPPANVATNSGQGGVFVSLRCRDSNRRLAREGYFHFDQVPFEVGKGIVLASFRAAEAARTRLSPDQLSTVKIGVSLLGQQEPVSLRELDFLKYGVVARSNVQPWKVGGALPNTQFFVSEIEQYRHAARTNARLGTTEPHTILRHTVCKSIEEGVEWPPFGKSQDAEALSPELASGILDRAHEILEGLQSGTHVPASAVLNDLPFRLDAVAVTLYAGAVVGCWISYGDSLDKLLVRAIHGAWTDSRYMPVRATARTSDISILVSFLYNEQCLGALNKEEVARLLRLGRDSLSIRCGNRRETILAHFACHKGWSSSDMVNALLKKAKLTRYVGSCWTTSFTESWLRWRGETLPVDFGFPRKPTPPLSSCLQIASLLANYMIRQTKSDGLPTYEYHPTENRREQSGTLGRLALAFGALGAAGDALQNRAYRSAAHNGLLLLFEALRKTENGWTLAIPRLSVSVGGRMILLNALAAYVPETIHCDGFRDLTVELTRMFQVDGAIGAFPPGRRIGYDHDLLPGVALLASSTLSSLPGLHLALDYDLHLRWYRRRFREWPNWGMTWWHAQAWASLYRRFRRPEFADFVFELADWVIERQLKVSGTFLVDYDPSGPGFYTACVLEGLAEAWSIAREEGHRSREAKYAQSWIAGYGYLASLIFQEADTYCTPDPVLSQGGVRESGRKSRVRIDFVGHALKALAIVASPLKAQS
jgi:AMMECR1 domain-containing protein